MQVPTAKVCLHERARMINSSRYTGTETQGAATSRNVLEASYHTQPPSPFLSLSRSLSLSFVLLSLSLSLSYWLSRSLPILPPSPPPGSHWTGLQVQAESQAAPQHASSWELCLIWIYLNSNKLYWLCCYRSMLTMQIYARRVQTPEICIIDQVHKCIFPP